VKPRPVPTPISSSDAPLGTSSRTRFSTAGTRLASAPESSRQHVSNLEASVRFYQRVFGFAVAERLCLGNEQLIFLQARGARIELIADGHGERQTGAVDHVAFEVDDLDTWLIGLRQLGVRLLDEAPVEVPRLGPSLGSIWNLGLG
jgi:predicted enzyme related to lactoylglutathione lyase